MLDPLLLFLNQRGSVGGGDDDAPKWDHVNCHEELVNNNDRTYQKEQQQDQANEY
jgi:hypothetical protein